MDNAENNKPKPKRTALDAELEIERNSTKPFRFLNSIQRFEKSLKGVRTTFPLTTIIQAHLASNTREEFAQELLHSTIQNEAYVKENLTRQAVAQKWLRNATSRIFPDDKRFLTELIINAGDAYLNPLFTIGKSGLGFFSVFNMLKIDATIEVKTSYYDTDGKLKTYSMIFEKIKDQNQYNASSNSNFYPNINNSSINVTFDLSDNTRITSPGTTVSIKPAPGRIFPKELLIDLQDSVYKSLYFYSHFPIFIQIQQTLTSAQHSGIINGGYQKSSLDKIVSVILKPDNIMVRDSGRGIPLWTALQDLLIPSNSIKAPGKKYHDTPLTPQISLSHNKYSQFFMTVNGITIVSKKLPTVLLDRENRALNLHVALPGQTRTTLARNEIVISQDGTSAEEAYLKNMIMETVTKATTGQLEHEHIIYALYQGLDSWEKESSATHIQGKFSKFLQDFLNQKLISTKTFAAPLEFIPTYNMVFKEANDGINIIPVHPALVYNNYEQLEEHLMQLGRARLGTPSRSPLKLLKQKGAGGALIYGLYVFCVKNIEKASHLGLRSCIFVPENIFTGVKNEQELINKLLLALPEKRYQSPEHIRSSQVQPLTPEQQQIYGAFVEQYRYLFEQFNLSPNALLPSNQFTYSWIENVINPLESLIPNKQIITTRLMQDSLSFNMFKIILEALKISPELLAQINLLNGTYLGGYRNLFNFTEKNLPYIYGQKNNKISPTLDRTATDQCGIIAPFIRMLDQEPDSKPFLNQIIKIQQKDFFDKVDTTNRDRLLSRYQLLIPSSINGTPLFFLSSLAARSHYNRQAFELIKTIINSVKSPAELAFITATLLSFSDNIFAHVLTPAGLQTLKAIINYYVQEKIEPEKIQNFYTNIQYLDCNNPHNIKNLVARESICKSIELIFEKLMQGQSNIGLTFSTLPPELIHQTAYMTQEQPFTLSQLFKAHCQKNHFADLLIQEDLQSIISLIEKLPTGGLKKIEQCIEDGSERNYLDGTIIECLQNSIDATRDLYNKDFAIINRNNAAHKLATIDLLLERHQMGNPEQEAIKLTMHDYAGFPSLKTLLTNFILPDLSEKSPETGAIGEMGNGSFKMYQYAQVVHVLTRTTNNPEICYLLTIEPIRSPHTNLVEDLKLTCKNVSKLVAPGFRGTSITITLQEESHQGIEMTLANAIDSLHHYVGSTTAHLTNHVPFKIMLHTNNEFIELNKDSSQECLDIFTQEDKPMITVFKRPEQNLTSIISTAGIPFCSFDKFVSTHNFLPPSFIKQLEKGYIIDFAPGTYEPVQSRTKLQLKIPTKALRQIFLDIYYAHGLKKAIDEQTIALEGKILCTESFLVNHFSHFFSRSNLFQLFPSMNDEQAFLQAINIFIDTGILQSHILESKFFDFYRFNNQKLPSFNQYLQAIKQRLLHKDMDRYDNMFHNLQKEYKADIDHYKTLTTYQEKQHALLLIKTKFEESLNRDLPVIQEEINTTYKKEIALWEASIINTLTPTSFNRPEKGLFKTIVMSWINCKINISNYPLDTKYLAHRYTELLNPAIIQATQSQEDLHTMKTNSIDANKIIALFNKVNTIFCSEFLSALKVQINQPISCLFSKNISSNLLGYYDTQENQIILNHKIVNFFDLLNLLKIISTFNIQSDSIEHIEKNITFQSLYFPTLGNTPTLIHELEHARRYNLLTQEPGKSGCENHDDGYDVDNQCVHFNACAQSWSQRAFSHGLLVNWITQIQILLNQNQDLIPLINNIVQKSPDPQTQEIITALLNIQSVTSQENKSSSSSNSIGQTSNSGNNGQDELKYASIKWLNQYLAAGNDINKQSAPLKSTMLHDAVVCELPKYVEALLKAGARVDLQDCDGNTPLHTLFDANYRKSSIKIAELLIAHKANLYTPNNKGETPFHIAIPQISEFYTPLLEYLDNINIQNPKTGETLLHVISKKPYIKMQKTLDALIQKGADTAIADEQGNLPLHYAVKYKNLAFIEKLLAPNKEQTINKRNNAGQTPLFFAMESNNMNIIKFLITQGASIDARDAQGNNILHHAIEQVSSIRKNIIEYVISQGVDMVNTHNNHGQLPLHKAQSYTSNNIFKILITNTINLNYQDKNGNTPLHSFLSNRSIINTTTEEQNFTNLTRLLLKKKLPLNLRNGHGLTPYHYARAVSYCSFFKEQHFQALHEEFHNTPLHWAAENGLFGYVHTHITSGKYNINSTRDGLSALHLACCNGHLETVQMLIKLGADIHQTDSWGQTALHWAALKNHSDILNLLIIQGASLDTPDSLGKTPLEILENKSSS